MLTSKNLKKKTKSSFATFYCSHCRLKFTYAIDTHKTEILCPICKRIMIPKKSDN